LEILKVQPFRKSLKTPKRRIENNVWKNVKICFFLYLLKMKVAPLLPPKDFGNKISKVVAAWATTVAVSKDFDRLDVRLRESRKDYATAAAAPAAAAPAAAVTPLLLPPLLLPPLLLPPLLLPPLLLPPLLLPPLLLPPLLLPPLLLPPLFLPPPRKQLQQ
jgi:hypothetical protein